MGWHRAAQHTPGHSSRDEGPESGNCVKVATIGDVMHVSGPALPVAVCVRRLIGAGAIEVERGADKEGRAAAPAAAGPEGARAVADLQWEGAGVTGQRERSIECSISWETANADDGERPGSEATVQARVGLMHLHGLERGRPRLLGIEVSSVASGVIAAIGLLAALFARTRGIQVSRVETSVTQAAALLIAQTIARSTSGGEWEMSLQRLPRLAGPGPPFPTRDGRWVELETLTPLAAA